MNSKKKPKTAKRIRNTVTIQNIYMQMDNSTIFTRTLFKKWVDELVLQFSKCVFLCAFIYCCLV